MKRLPYWLVGGTETCDHCSFSYVREVELRCAGCDRGFCEQCMVLVRERGEWRCGGCRSADEEEEAS